MFYRNQVVYQDLKPGDFSDLWWADVVEVKHDGMWVEVAIDADGNATAVSRNGTRKASWRVPAGIGPAMLIGELMVGTTHAVERGIVGSLVVFDCVDRHGSLSELGLADRRTHAASIIRAAGIANWSLVEQRPVAEAAAMWRELVEVGGEEGLVFKHSGQTFGMDWARMKRIAEVDFVCLGFNRGKSGAVVSVQAGLYDASGTLRHVCDIGGVNRGMAAGFDASPAKYVGRVFKATGNRMFASGALRHGAFGSWHADKHPSNCRMA